MRQTPPRAEYNRNYGITATVTTFLNLSPLNLRARITHIRENGAASGAGVLAAYSFDDFRQVTDIIFGNGTAQSFAFDTAQRLSVLGSDLSGSANDQSASFTYTPAGQIDALIKSNDGYRSRR